MTLTEFAIKDPVAFAEFVAILRSVGVVKLGALVLGPVPQQPQTREVDPDAAARRRHEVMFAASRIRPPFVPSEAVNAPEPKIVAQRRATEEANGPQKPRK